MQEKQSLLRRYGYAIKAVAIFVLVLVLLIPTVMISELIRERQLTQADATKEVSAKWAGEQTITGPVLVIPYLDDQDAGNIHYAYLLPDQLKVNGEVLPEIRKRGIFPVAVFDSKIQLEGTFSGEALEKLNIPESKLLTGQAAVIMGISDLRGIGNEMAVQWNDKTLPFNPGLESADLLPAGVRAAVPFQPGVPVTFAVSMQLKGSGTLAFSPVGKTTSVQLRSAWPSPSFDGAFLPAKRTVTDKGFSAAWEVLHHNRNFPQSWKGKEFNINGADFGVKLFMPVDNYQQTMRAVKYAILIIGLTFLVFYFIELLQRRPVHPLQYILIGVALCIFYSLLLSISERLNFSTSYLIAAVMTIGLIAAYTASVFKDKRTALVIGSILTLLYGFIYVIIQSEDQALLMGSIGLFLILALVMYVSRRIRWETLGS